MIQRSFVGTVRHPEVGIRAGYLAHFAVFDESNGFTNFQWATQHHFVLAVVFVGEMPILDANLKG